MLFGMGPDGIPGYGHAAAKPRPGDRLHRRGPWSEDAGSSPTTSPRSSLRAHRSAQGACIRAPCERARRRSSGEEDRRARHFLADLTLPYGRVIYDTQAGLSAGHERSSVSLAPRQGKNGGSDGRHPFQRQHGVKPTNLRKTGIWREMLFRCAYKPLFRGPWKTNRHPGAPSGPLLQQPFDGARATKDAQRDP